MVKYSELEKNEINPFMRSTFELQMKEKSKRIGISNKVMLDEVSGETTNVKMVMSIQKRVDADKFVKLYIDKVERFLDLSTPGKKVLKYIWGRLKPNSDELYVNIPDMMEEIGWEQSNQAYRGLMELCNAEVIAKGKNTGFFFINPTIFFNGDRMVLVEEYIKKRNGEGVIDKLPSDPLKQLRGSSFDSGDDYIRVGQ